MLSPGIWGDRRVMRIGLLGGSFNPGHVGHLHLSHTAKKYLSLDQVWWLVTPKNPLKKSMDIPSTSERIRCASNLDLPPWIHLTDLELSYKTKYTSATLKKLIIRYPKANFIWLMGADNLVQISMWVNWTSIFDKVRIAVFDRGTDRYKSLFSKASIKYKKNRVSISRPTYVWCKSAPSWVFFPSKKVDLSSSQIRSLNTQKRGVRVF